MASTSKNGEKEKDKNPSANQDDSKAREVTPVCIDFANIDQRILALPFPSRNYSGMLAVRHTSCFCRRVRRLTTVAATSCTSTRSQRSNGQSIPSTTGRRSAVPPVRRRSRADRIRGNAGRSSHSAGKQTSTGCHPSNVLGSMMTWRWPSGRLRAE